MVCDLYVGSGVGQFSAGLNTGTVNDMWMSHVLRFEKRYAINTHFELMGCTSANHSGDMHTHSRQCGWH